MLLSKRIPLFLASRIVQQSLDMILHLASSNQLYVLHISFLTFKEDNKINLPFDIKMLKSNKRFILRRDPMTMDISTIQKDGKLISLHFCEQMGYIPRTLKIFASICKVFHLFFVVHSVLDGRLHYL